MKKFYLLAVMAIMSLAATAGLITAQPEGTLKTYDRSGYSYYVYNENARRGAQTGTVDIVFGANNEVYIKDPLAKALVGTWVKGTLSADGKTITLPMGQAISYDATQKDTVILAMVDYDEEYEEFSENTRAKSVTYTIKDDGSITLNGTSSYAVLGCIWQKTRAWATYADYSTKYTPKTVADEPVTPPADLKTETWKFSGRSYIYERNVAHNITVGKSGNDVYIQGLFTDVPKAWVKGSLKNGKYVFHAGQFLGVVESNKTNSYYMIACNAQNTKEIQDWTLEYNATGDTLVDPSQFLVLNLAKTTVYLMDAYSDVKIYKANTAGIYDVPYAEHFDGSLDDFKVIDANGDGVTWVYNNMSQTVDYNWSNTNNGDDWLMTPGIRMEQGLTYEFSVDARSFTASTPEKMEVKAGSAQTVAGMTTQVIPVTTVATGDLTAFKGIFTAKADGVYYFGIHAVSDKGNMTLTVDNVAVTLSDKTGVADVTTSSTAVPVAHYSVAGQRIGADVQGIHIVRMSDGTARKIMVK